jgi:hypothetical protein
MQNVYETETRKLTVRVVPFAVAEFHATGVNVNFEPSVLSNVPS